MLPSLNIGDAIRSLSVSDREVHDAQVKLRCTEEEVEIAERIEVSEIRPIRHDPVVVSFPEGHGASQVPRQSITNPQAESATRTTGALPLERSPGPSRPRKDNAACRAIDPSQRTAAQKNTVGPAQSAAEASNQHRRHQLAVETIQC